MASGASLLFLSRGVFAQSGDPTDLDIVGAGKLIRSGDLSPVDLVDAYLDRIDQFNSQINAYITVTGQAARVRARELEVELVNGRWRGPMHGIPIALKDNMDTAGIRTTAASAVYADRVPDEDAEVVRRLQDAGAIILGKLNMHEFAYGATSAISHFGPVRNPWNTRRIPGGSSGGSGADLAARLCAGALGTDTGGSIRIPAAYCGIVGLKPTYGLASIRGIIPLMFSLDHVGPMCRTVADAAVVLQAIAGYDAKDIPSIKTDVPNYSSAIGRNVSAYRLGVPQDIFYDGIDEQILGATETAISFLGEMTAGTRTVELPSRPEGVALIVEAYEYHEDLLGETSDLYDEVTLARIMRGAKVSASEYAAYLAKVKLNRKAIDAVFDEVDLVISPTMARLPVPVDNARDEFDGPTLIRNTMPFNHYGIPTISVPCGFSNEGLPIGLQISGPGLGEVDVLALAHAYEQKTTWHERIPVLA